MPDLNDVFGYREGRPTHPHFAMLSNIVLQHDGKTEDTDFDYDAYVATKIDPDSLTYMASQRALRVAGPLAPSEIVAALASLFLDGFMIGTRWQEDQSRRFNYDEACKRAATDQGLDPVTEALKAAGHAPNVEQTGGFTMVVTVAYEDGTFGVTASDETEGRYLVGWYPGTSWDDGEGLDESAVYRDGLTLDEVVTLISEHRQT